MKKLLFAICLIMTLLFAFGCTAKETQNNGEATDKTETTETVVTTENSNEDWTNYVQAPVVDPTFSSTEEKTYTIDTKYVKLTYPEKWKDSVRYEINEQEPYTVTFYMTSGAIELPLFDLVFGESGDYKLGTLTTDQETVSLYVNHYEMENVGMTNEDYESWVAMSEDINVIIAELVNDYDFQIA